MRIFSTLFGSLSAVILLAGCGHQTEPSTRSLPAPFAYLSLIACKDYADGIVECQLEYGTEFGRQRLGPVQEKGFPTDQNSRRHQVTSCYQVSRIQYELPNFVCKIAFGRSGPEVVSVLIKGGTAVRLARILGDRDQIGYRWTPDRWSRLQD